MFKLQGVTSQPRYDQNRLGGSVGGPIIKNRLFYYGLYEYNPVGYAATDPGAWAYHGGRVHDTVVPARALANQSWAC